MADVLLELGSTHRMGAVPDFSDIADFVAYNENPLVGILAPGEQLSPRQELVAAKLREISRQQRLALVRPGVSVAGIEGMYLAGPNGHLSMGDLRSILSELAAGDLGKFSLKKIVSKVKGILKSPIAKIVAGVAAGVGIGVLAKTAIDASKKAAAEKEKKKQQKEAEAQAASDAQIVAQAQAEANAAAQQAAQEQQNAVNAQQTAAAVQSGQVSPVDYANMLKGFGQVAAIRQMENGAGSQSSFTPEMGAAVDALAKNPKVQAALAAGKQDLLNSAAAAGSTSAIQSALNAGAGSTNTLILVGGGVLAVGVIAWVMTRRR